MPPTKIVVIGAGSASFGLNTVAALLGSQKLRGSQIALVDRNAEALALTRRLVERLSREWDAQMTITAHPHHADALDGAAFVVSAIEAPPREQLWRSDVVRDLDVAQQILADYLESYRTYSPPEKSCPA